MKTLIIILSAAFITTVIIDFKMNKKKAKHKEES